MKLKHDKRRTKRINEYHLVKYRLAFTPDKPLLANIKDISAGGARLVTEKQLPVGSLLQIYINFPWLNSPVPVLAKIIWVKKPGRRIRFESGLEFSEIEDIIRKDIHGRIENVL